MTPDKHKAFQEAYDSYPSQDNEGYVPERGSFKSGFFAGWAARDTEIARLREALEWYAQEWLYDLTSYRALPKMFDLNNPQNVEMQGNPIMNDRGEKARQALQGKE